MEFVRLGHSGLKVSRLCLGTMNMGTPQWKPWIFDEKQSEPIVRHALEAGVNFIDLADFYSTGVGEEVVGRILGRLARREEIVVTTKVGYDMGAYQNAGGHSRKHIMDGIDGSLKRLGMDYVDIYMLHYFDVNTPVEETMAALDDVVRSGKARYIGVSTMYTWQLAKIMQACERHGWHKPINMQLQLNLAYREEEREMMPYCADQGLGVSVFSPLARGLLTCDAASTRNQTDFFTAQMYGDAASREIAASVARVAARRGVSAAQIAQAWVLQNSGVASMLVGADSPAQFDSALAALGTQLDADELYELERNYTPCDLINDYTAGRRIARAPRAPRRHVRPRTGAGGMSLMRNGHYIDGAWHAGKETYAVRNPATGATIAEVAKAGAAETQRAIDAAQRAFPAWRALTAKERGARVKRWGELMLAQRDALAELLTREQGKPLAEAKGEVAYAASFLEWFAEEAKRSYGDVIPSPKPDSKIVVTREPVGVVAAITPWNFPLAMITRKAGPALAAGCTMVLKPSEETPLSAFALAVLAEEAGVPPGVFNIVSGDALAIGATLTASPVVRKLSFTGSTRVGKLLAAQSADTLKKLSLELGGNAPFIVFDDADLDAAVQGAMASKFRNTGQTCVCVNRFYVQDGIYDAFTRRARRSGEQAAHRRCVAGRGRSGPADQRSGAEKSAATRRRRAEARRDGAHRRPAASARRDVLRADRPHRRERSHARRPGRNLRPGGRVLSLQHRSRGDRTGEQHAVRPVRVLLHARSGPRVARRRCARERHGRHQRRTHFDGSRAVRRRQAIRPGPRRIEVRTR